MYLVLLRGSVRVSWGFFCFYFFFLIAEANSDVFLLVGRQ